MLEKSLLKEEMHFVSKEAEKCVKLLKEAENSDVLCVYGLGLGYFYLAAKQWLKEKENRSLVFLEDEKEVFDKFSQTTLAKAISKDKRVKIYFFKDLEKKSKEIAWENIFLEVKIISYLKDKQEKFKNIKKELERALLGVHLVASDYSDFGISHFFNVFSNVLKTPKIKLAKHLKNSFKDVPAIICGAGPSIEKNIDHLKQLTDKALILAGGSALNVLSENKIKPHFAASIDKEAPFQRFKKHKFFDVPFFYQNQMSAKNFSFLQKQKLLVGDNGEYQLEKWLYNKIGIEIDTFDTGWTVATFLLSLAHFMGCNPIIFVGLDCSFKNNRYAKGVKEGSENYTLIKAKDIYNQEIFTQKDWIEAANWIAEFAKDKEIYNANGEGLYIKNVKEEKLLSLSKKNFLKTSKELAALTQQKLQKIEYVYLEKTEKTVQEIMDNAQFCINLCIEALREMEEGKSLAIEKLQSQFFYSYHLLPLWRIFYFVIKRELEKEESHHSFDFILLLNKIIFFKNVCEQFAAMSKRVLIKKKIFHKVKRLWLKKEGKQHAKSD